ncbi:MAG: YybS family protein [Clostridiales bacterium]|nr:YybS family protein [Clostridiales bacterium]
MRQQAFSKRALIEASLIAGIVSIFAIIGAVTPLLSILLILLPVPFIFITVRHKFLYSFFSIIITSLVLGIFLGIVYSFFLLIMILPMTIAMGRYIKKEKEPFFVITIGTMVATISTFFIIKLVGEINITQIMADAMREVLAHQQEMLLSINLTATVEVDNMINYFIMLLPALLVVQAIVSTFANYYLCIASLRRFAVKNVTLSEFSNFKLPKNIVLGAFIIFVLSFLTRYVEGLYHDALIMNIVVIFAFIFFMQGLAFINYYMKKMKVHKALRVILTIIVVLVGPIMTVTSFIGVIDSIFDIRK